jgi:hypothetical protein
MSDPAKIRHIEPDEHREHHEFLRDVIPLVREYLDERKMARERWEKYRTSFFGAIFAALGAAAISVFAWIGRLFIEWLRSTPSG